jgi:mannose-6-phosphate isomerase-like protein (cupin superfamily)
MSENEHGRSDLVRVPDEVPVETWDDAERGRLGFRTIFSAEVTGTSDLTSGVAELEPGGRLNVHHHVASEVYHVLEGSGRLHLDGDEHDVRAGSSVFIPGGTPHGIRNAGSSTLRLFYVLAADGMGDVEYHFGDT